MVSHPAASSAACREVDARCAVAGAIRNKATLSLIYGADNRFNR
jgi:hypothetical protein